MNERVHGALVQLGCYQYSPCGKVHDCTMKMRRLPQIIRTFPHTISTNTVKKFYTAALCDTQWRFAGVQLTVILVVARFFSAVMMHYTAFLLPKVSGYAPKCAFAHNRTNGLRVPRLTSHNTRVTSTQEAPYGVINTCVHASA